MDSKKLPSASGSIASPSQAKPGIPFFVCKMYHMQNVKNASLGDF